MIKCVQALAGWETVPDEVGGRFQQHRDGNTPGMTSSTNSRFRRQARLTSVRKRFAGLICLGEKKGAAWVGEPKSPPCFALARLNLEPRSRLISARRRELVVLGDYAVASPSSARRRQPAGSSRGVRPVRPPPRPRRPLLTLTLTLPMPSPPPLRFLLPLLSLLAWPGLAQPAEGSAEPPAASPLPPVLIVEPGEHLSSEACAGHGVLVAGKCDCFYPYTGARCLDFACGEEGRRS